LRPLSFQGCPSYGTTFSGIAFCRALPLESQFYREIESHFERKERGHHDQAWFNKDFPAFGNGDAGQTRFSARLAVA
jgi:hypothetical protein